MSSNRVQYFIRSILQNTKLNREKFIKNKKIYNDLSVKNKRNPKILFFKRNFNTNSYGSTPSKFDDNDNNNNNNNNNLIIFGAAAIVPYITQRRFNEKK